VLLTIAGAPFKGAPTARLTLIEFSDYQCPFCARHAGDTLAQVERDYVKTGKVKYVVRDLPIEAIDPQAFKAAEAAHCAGEQARFWDMHARLFASQAALGVPDLLQHAGKLGLDTSRASGSVWRAAARRRRFVRASPRDRRPASAGRRLSFSD
jgi:hypothetical protein